MRRARAGLRRSAAMAVSLLLTLAHPAHGQHWPLWQAYGERFIDAQGRVVDHTAHERTTSEGQSYAMFFALVNNDRARFDKLLGWTEANLAQGDLTLKLPAWNWGQSPTGEWKVLDDNSASDADLWMAYTLMEAGRLWRHPRYEKLGRLLALRIAHEEVVTIRGFGKALVPGKQGFRVDAESYTLNPSYVPVPLLTYLAKAVPEGPWREILGSLPELLGGQVGKGYAMDWVLAGPGGVKAVGQPTQPGPVKQETRAGGSYDAIRVYLWLGLSHPGTPGLKRLLTQMSSMGEYLLTNMVPPLEVDARGKVVRPDAPVGFSAATTPYLLALGMPAQAKVQQDRVEAMKDSASGLYGRTAEYYDQNLVLFSTGWGEERYRFGRDGTLLVKWK